MFSPQVSISQMLKSLVICMACQGGMVCNAHGQVTEEAVREAIWKLDSAAELPSKYALAVVGEQSMLSATKGPGSVEKSYVIVHDGDAEFRIDAGNTELLDNDMNALPDGWKVVLSAGDKRTYRLGRHQTETFDLSSKLEEKDRDRITALDTMCYRFDPRVMPIAPPSFNFSVRSSTDVIFKLYENGHVEFREILGGKVATDWVVGAARKGKVSIEFEQSREGVLLPVVAKWSAPNPNTVDRQTPNFATVYVVKTEWQLLEVDEGRSVSVPKRLTSSYLVGRPPHGDTIDTELNFYWVASIPDKLAQNWQEVDWYGQLEQIKKKASEK